MAPAEPAGLGPAGGWFKPPAQWAAEQVAAWPSWRGPDPSRMEQFERMGFGKEQPAEAPYLPTLWKQWPGTVPPVEELPPSDVGTFMAAGMPEPTMEQLEARRVEIAPEPRPEVYPALAERAMGVAARAAQMVGVAWGLVPEPVRAPTEKVVGGVLEAFGMPAKIAKRGLGVVQFELYKRTPLSIYDQPFVPAPRGYGAMSAEEREQQQRIHTLVKEINPTPDQENQLSTSHWTWLAHPDRLEQALGDVEAGADPLEVAEKYQDYKAEMIGELAVDPLFFAPILTKPLTKLIGGTVQGIKKFKPIAPLFKLSKRSIVQVAKFDTEDIAKVIFKSGDDAKTMAKTLDSFLDDSAKFADDLRPRGAAQAESIADLIKGSGLKGKNIIKKGMTRAEAVDATSQAIGTAAAKAVGYNPSAQRTFINGVQQVLVEHWLGTRPAWLVYNYADNTLKLGIEGVGPWFRLEPNLARHIERYGDVPAQISAGFSKSITGMSDISMHERVMGLPGKPVTAIMSKGARMEGTARTRLYIHDFANIARGGRDDALRLADDMLGPVDDAVRGLIRRDVSGIRWPNVETLDEAIMRFHKKKVSLTSPYSFIDDAGRIPDEEMKAVAEGLKKAKTPEDVAKVLDDAGVRATGEATEYMKRMGQPGDWTPYSSFDDVGGPSAVFAEGGEELIGFRPDLNHEVVGELAHEVGINFKHARNVLKKINRDLGVDEGLLWAAAKRETGGESARLWWNYLLGEADKKNVVLPSWVEAIDLVDEAPATIAPTAARLAPERPPTVPLEEGPLAAVGAPADIVGDMAPDIGAPLEPELARFAPAPPAVAVPEAPPARVPGATQPIQRAALIPDELRPLAEEARKYKTAEAFHKKGWKPIKGEVPWELRTRFGDLVVEQDAEWVRLTEAIRVEKARGLKDWKLIHRLEREQKARLGDLAGDFWRRAQEVPEAPGIAQRLIHEERGSVIAQPILDEFARWRTSATDDLARAGETIEQSPEAMKAIREYAKAAKKIMRSTLDDAPIKASLKVNKTLGNYTERNKLSEMMRDIITFWDWPAYNIPYWARTFAEKPMVPATFAKARAFTAAANEGLPDRLKYSVRLPIPPELLEKVGFAPESALYTDPYRYLSFMQQTPGGTPYQASKLREAMDDPTSPESIWTIGSQMGYRTWPWNESILGAAGVLGDDWYPFDLSSYESIARAVFDTDMTPSSWWREKMGLEPNKFLEWQTQKEVRAQIMRGEEADWEAAREKARNKGGFLATMAILGVPVKEYTAEEAERMGMSTELRDAVKTDVERTGGDPTTMGYQEQWTWAKRHGATMKDEPSAINKFYEANPDYPDLPWESEEEWQIDQDLSASFEEKGAARTERDGRISDLAIPHPREALNLIWGDYFDELAAINEKYPNANITPSTDRPIEYLKDQTQQAMLRQLDQTKPDYYATVGDKEEGERVYESYEDYSRALREWEAGLRATALELWGAETFSNFQHLATPEALEEYDKSHHTIASAAHYTWKKHIEPPFYEDAQWAQVSRLAGKADWENVTERISQWSDLIETVAEPAEIDPRIIAAIIDVESSGDPTRINKLGCTGLMQVCLFEDRPSQDELLNPKTNIEEGVDLLVEYLAGTDYDLKDALYEYSGGSEWSSREAYEKQYWDRLSSKFKGLWGVSLGTLRADARDTVMARPMALDVETLLPLIMMEYPGRWTPDEIRAELRGKDIMGVLEAQREQRPDTAAARDASTEVWDTRAALPPGVYRKAIDELPEVASFLSTGQNPKAALEAIEVYTDEHPVTGNAQEWAQAEREHDEFRRWVYNEPGLGASIYEEQNAYYAAREEGRRVEPSERLEAYWDAHTQFRVEHPLYTKYYFPGWEPKEKKAPAAGRARKLTKAEEREAQAKTWTEFAASFTGGAGLLELIQSWLLLTPSQREWFLRGHPELSEWLMRQDPEWLGQLRASLGASQPVQRGGGGFQWRPDQPRWYKSW